MFCLQHLPSIYFFKNALMYNIFSHISSGAKVQDKLLKVQQFEYQCCCNSLIHHPWGPIKTNNKEKKKKDRSGS